MSHETPPYDRDRHQRNHDTGSQVAAQARSHRYELGERGGAASCASSGRDQGLHRDLGDAELAATCLFKRPRTSRLMTSRSRRLSGFIALLERLDLRRCRRAASLRSSAARIESSSTSGTTGLIEEFERSAFHRLHRRVNVGAAGHEDDRHVDPIGHQPLQSSPLDPGSSSSTSRQLGVVARSCVEKLLGRSGRSRLPSGGTNQSFQFVARFFVPVDDEHDRRRRRLIQTLS